jgi:hypothetical protein
VCDDSTVAQLHEILQITFGWNEKHLTKNQRPVSLSARDTTCRTANDAAERA